MPQDINCDIQNDTIYAVVFAGTDCTALKPTFSFKGAAVTVAGREQAAGINSNNFNEPVIYSIKATDGSDCKFVVKISNTKIPALYISTNNIPVQSKEIYVTGHLNIKGMLCTAFLPGRTRLILTA